MRRKISQIQIARELGVSQSLVSNALNGRKEGIAKESYDRIWAYARKHGYRPKGMVLPDSIESQTLPAVGYILRAPLRLATKSNFFSHVTQGLHDYLRERKVNMVFLGGETDFSEGGLQPEDWQSKHLKGIAILGEVAPEFLQSVRALGKPIVYIAARAPGLCHSVNPNEQQSADQLVDHLVDEGHRHFAFLGPQFPNQRAGERLQGMRLALQRHGLKVEDSAVFRAPEAERTDGQGLAREIVAAKLRPFPTAWVCFNALMARGAINGLLQERFMAGRDVSVCAFDNTRICTEEFPGITGASAIPEQMGREAGTILLRNELGASLTDVVLPSVLYTRESTGPAPTAKPATVEQ